MKSNTDNMVGEAQTEEYSAETHEIEVVDTPKYTDLENIPVGFTDEEITAIQTEYNKAVKECAHIELTQDTIPHTVSLNGLTGCIHEIEIIVDCGWMDDIESAVESVNGRTFRDFARILADEIDDDVSYDDDPDGWYDTFQFDLLNDIGLSYYKFKVTTK